MTIRELWEKYRRQVVLCGAVESPAEVALQRAAFICGVVTALGELAVGTEIDCDDAERELDEALEGVLLEIDRRGGNRP